MYREIHSVFYADAGKSDLRCLGIGHIVDSTDAADELGAGAGAQQDGGTDVVQAVQTDRDDHVAHMHTDDSAADIQTGVGADVLNSHRVVEVVPGGGGEGAAGLGLGADVDDLIAVLLGAGLLDDEGAVQVLAALGGQVDAALLQYGVDRLEKAIDRLDAELPPLNAFVLPGGCYPASVCHVCRTVCRRSERCMLALEERCQTEINPLYKSFMNRLSDYLFVLARKLNVLDNHEENYWIKTCK